MILMKSCPRCHGDMMREEILGEVELVCLQCGHRTSAETEQSWRVRVPARVKKAA
jgi:DNA-directed RNA polymerase subunit M/transcription elongation factor TFIIS